MCHRGACRVARPPFLKDLNLISSAADVMKTFYFFIYFYFLAVLGMDPRVWCRLSTRSTIRP